jgi:hypothetical protein
VSARIVTVLLASAAVAVGACQPPDDELDLGPRYCPSGDGESVSPRETVDARVLVNEKVDDAAQAVRQYGCRVRVVIRDGHTEASGRPAPRVIDVEVRDGRITRIIRVGER